MTPSSFDTAVVRAIEGSAIVRGVERAGRFIAAAASSSRVLSAARPMGREIAAWPGEMLLTAAAVHVVLAFIGSRPPAWYWLIIPAGFAAAGAVLMCSRRRMSRE